MGTSRLEAFSDGVLAIIITIMVLELKVPHGDSLSDIVPLIPTVLSYILSFIYVGIYWNNHHHLLHTCNHVTGKILWSNLHLLFWLSLLPFATGWLGEHYFGTLPTAFYGFVLLMAAFTYFILQHAIIDASGSDSILEHAIGKNWKGKISIAIYIIGMVSSAYLPTFAQLLYATAAIMWIVPDKRIEAVLPKDEN